MRILLALTLALALYAQTNQVQLGDQQTVRHFIIWEAPASIASTVIVKDFTPAALGYVISGNAVHNLYPSTTPGLHAWYDPTYGNSYFQTYNLSGVIAPFNVNQTGSAGLLGGYIVTPGIVSDVPGGGSWQGFNSNTDGILARGYHIAQNAAGTLGGYAAFAPITYPPYGSNGGNPSTVCYDVYGNVVEQPTPLNGLPANAWTGGSNTNVIEWNSTSPLQGYYNPSNPTLMPTPYPMSGTPCAAPIPVPWGRPYGINSNSYYFSLIGFASANYAYNTVQLLGDGIHTAGGVIAGQLEAASIYPQGTLTRAGTISSPKGIGGYGYLLASDQAPSGYAIVNTSGTSVTWVSGITFTTGPSWNNTSILIAGVTYKISSVSSSTALILTSSAGTQTGVALNLTIAQVDNPLISGMPVSEGMYYADQVNHCLSYYNGTSWGCVGSVGGAGNWTLSSSLLYPNSTSYQVLVGLSADDGSGSALEISGRKLSGNYNAINAMGTIQSYLASGSADATTLNWQGLNHSGSPTSAIYGSGEFGSYLGLYTMGPQYSSAFPSLGSWGGLGFEGGPLYWFWNSASDVWGNWSPQGASHQCSMSECSGGRAYNTVYQNTNSTTMKVAVTIGISASSAGASALTDTGNPPTTSAGFLGYSAYATGYGTLTFDVLPNSYYEVTTSGTVSTLPVWMEWW